MMGDLIERLGKLQDSCNKQELGLLDTDYVFELAGRTADELERRERLTVKMDLEYRARIAELEQECEVLLERLDAEYLAEAELQEDDK
jgi:hypothetical protein